MGRRRSDRRRKSRPHFPPEGGLFVTMEMATRDISPTDFTGCLPPCKAVSLIYFPTINGHRGNGRRGSPAPHSYHGEDAFIHSSFVAKEMTAEEVPPFGDSPPLVSSIDFLLALECRFCCHGNGKGGSSAPFPLCYFLFKVCCSLGTCQGRKSRLINLSSTSCESKATYDLDLAKEEVPPFSPALTSCWLHRACTASCGTRLPWLLFDTKILWRCELPAGDTELYFWAEMSKSHFFSALRDSRLFSIFQRVY